MISRARVLDELGLGPRWILRDAAVASSPPAAASDGASEPAIVVRAPTTDEASRADAILQMDWSQLKASVAGCAACGLSQTRNRTVFGVGDEGASWLVVGEGPGADEDARGEPFVGQAGRLLDSMLAAIALERGADVYIANVLKIRPPNNATPTPDERNASAPYLYDQIAAVNPEVIVTLGLPATQTILGTDLPMSKLRGQWATFTHPDRAKACTVPIMPTYHPAYLLRSYTPENRKLVWSDLKKVIEKLTT